MNIRSTLIALSTLFLSVVSNADTRAHEKEELARFKQFATAPVDHFKMVELFRSQVVGPQDVVIWSTINDAYLLTVQQPCRQLAWATGLTVTQAQKWQVSLKFDSIDVGSQCRIVEIKPIDLAAMQKAERASKG